jgi:hypothetical protein
MKDDQTTGRGDPWIDEAKSVSEAVVDRVAAARNVEPWDLSPLGERINADALDNLFRTSTAVGASSNLSTSFAYVGETVIVDEEGVSLVKHES